MWSRARHLGVVSHFKRVRNLKKQLDRVDWKSPVLVIHRGVPLWSCRCQTVHLDADCDRSTPYDAMINYCDSSDLMYVWLKRATKLLRHRVVRRSLLILTDYRKRRSEAVIKFGSVVGDDHRTEAHYKSCITRAFDPSPSQSRLRRSGEHRVRTRRPGRVGAGVDSDFGRRVWFSPGSWPCSTEKGGKQTGEYIDNTIMMACRAAAADRPCGGRAESG